MLLWVLMDARLVETHNKTFRLAKAHLDLEATPVVVELEDVAKALVDRFSVTGISTYGATLNTVMRRIQDGEAEGYTAIRSGHLDGYDYDMWKVIRTG